MVKAAVANRVIENGQKSDPLAMLKQLDGAAIAEQLEQAERHKAEAVAEFDKQIDALKVFAKAVQLRDHGKPERKKPVRKAGSGKPSGALDAKDLVFECRQRLLVHRPSKPGIIAADIGSNAIAVGKAMFACPRWFRQTPEGYTLTQDGIDGT